MGAHAAADTAIVSLSRARVCQGSKIWNSHPKAVSYSSQILKVKFFTLDDDELVDPSFQN